MQIQPIAFIQNDFKEKFGIPRQSGLVELPSRIVFQPEYRNREAFRGLEEFSHIWLIWEFSKVVQSSWSPTVRPPRLGGNQRKGVFATRSPFRPNPLGLSVVAIKEIVLSGKDAPYLIVTGADLLDGTPIYDIKPYLPHIDSHPKATGGFALKHADDHLNVSFPPALLAKIPKELQQGLLQLLAQDPRPSYQNDPDRIYGFTFGAQEIRFTVRDNTLTVCEIIP